MTVGTILAGDGLVIEIEQPSLASLRGRPISIFRNRKSMWGLIVQAFCDAHTKFHVFDISWPGGTSGIVAYLQKGYKQELFSGMGNFCIR